MRILIVDDEPNIRQTLRVALEAMGHAAARGGPRRPRRSRAVERDPCDVALVDLRLGHRVGPRPAGAAAGAACPGWRSS